MAGRSTILKIDILGDASSARRAADQTGAAFDRMGRRVDSSGGAASRSQSKVARLGAAFGGAAAKFGPLAAAAGGAALLKFGADSISAASDVQQAFGGIDAVFGKNAATVKQWAKDAATDVGLAKSEYASMANTLGSALRNTGIEDYTSKTNDLIAKGADLAATFGGTTSDAVRSLSAVLRGEYDPIERYGVTLRESDISARLAATGQDKLTGAALRSAEQQARLDLLMQQTTTSTGRFSQESETLAGQQQRLSARFENLKATLGEKLLPVATKVVTWLADTVAGSNDTSKFVRKMADVFTTYVTPIVESLRSGVKKLSDALDDATGSSKGSGDGLKKIGDVIEDLAPIVGKLQSDQLTLLFEVLSGLVRVTGGVAGGINDMRKAADKALGPLDELIGKLSSPQFSAGGLIGSLFRSSPGSLAGLGRADGTGALGGAGSFSTRVNVEPVFIIRPSVDTGSLVDLMDFRIEQHARSTATTSRRGA